MPTKAPYTHLDGSPCWTKNCSRNHIAVQNAYQKIQQALPAIETTDSIEPMNDMIGKRFKHPHTPHLPFSLSVQEDDFIINPKALKFLQSGIPLVTTSKMDGGSVTYYPDFFHARSIDSGTHKWDQPAKKVWARIHNDIPEGWRITGESMYARRSVGYENLPGPFLLYAVWNDKNEMLTWDEIEQWANLWEIPTVPVLYKGNDYNEAIKAWGRNHSPENSEGFVLRNAGSFTYDDFENNIAKMVRANHIQTSDDWRRRDDFALNTFQTWQ